MDASLIRAHVRFDSRVAQHLEAATAADPDAAGRQSRSSGKDKTLCVTDPDATMATLSAGRHLQPSDKQHTAADDSAGIVGDVDIVTGAQSDAARIAGRHGQIERTLGRVPGTAAADAGFGAGQIDPERQPAIFTLLRASPRTGGGDAISRTVPSRGGRGSAVHPMDRFKCDQHNDNVRCPRGNAMTPRTETSRTETPIGRWFRSDPAFSKRGPLRFFTTSDPLDRS